MAPPSRSGRSRFTLVLLILTSVTLLTLDFRDYGPLEGVREGALELFAPVKDTAARVFEPVGDAWSGAFGYDDLDAENEDLRREIERLEGALADVEANSSELAALRDELEIDYVGDIPRVVAAVEFGPVSNFDQTLEIDKGSTEGIAVGQPVVTSAGLVGRIELVSPHRAVVMLLTDPSFRVGVRLLESGEVGVATGQGSGEPLLVNVGISADVEIVDGELLTTSGLERSLFPEDLPVARTVRGIRSPGDLDQDVVVEPLADLDDPPFVSVLIWEPDR